jgi:hypothetical protein
MQSIAVALPAAGRERVGLARFRFLILAAGRGSWLAYDLLRSGSKSGAWDLSDAPRLSGVAAGARQIVGKVERHPGTPTPSAEAQSQRGQFFVLAGHGVPG